MPTLCDTTRSSPLPRITNMLAMMMILLLPFCFVSSALGLAAYRPPQPTAGPAKSASTAPLDDTSSLASSRRRRNMIASSSVAIWTMMASVPIESSHAKYGASSTMELPNYIDYLIEKNSFQAGDDPSQRLYQGADSKVLLERLLDANQRLNEVSALAEARKWSQIQGLVTGPLGTLSQTLNTMVKEKPKVLTGPAKQVKTSVIGIGQAASTKNAEQCVQLAKQAQTELQMFVEKAFE